MDRKAIDCLLADWEMNVSRCASGDQLSVTGGRLAAALREAMADGDSLRADYDSALREWQTERGRTVYLEAESDGLRAEVERMRAVALDGWELARSMARVNFAHDSESRAVEALDKLRAEAK